ncbi:hypothetical protein TNCV_3849271 [Trichonephila clavipes]|uniref:Uncharacterized protein n=1 Tax=Trichonephila clavipes TaxID=2585209 RepID=A0A8X6RD49_TRICX|nr:hypothetical protein TNCV_3849271 [Trichonephila clavipes]
MNYYNANNEDNINVKNNKGLDEVPDSPEADLKRLFNPAMVVEDTVPKQTSEQWEDLTQLLDKFQTIFSQNKYDAVTPKCLGGPPVDRDRLNAHSGPRRIRRKHKFGVRSKDAQLSYEDDLRRTMFSSIARLDQAPQDINEEEFQLERVRLQAFVAAKDTGCKKELIRSGSLGLLLLCVYYWDTYERREIDEQSHRRRQILLQTMIPAYNKKRCAAFPFETGIHFRRKTDFPPEEDTTKSYSGFEPTRLQAEGYSHHAGWATLVLHEKCKIIDESPKPTMTFASYSKRTEEVCDEAKSSECVRM